MQHKFYSIIVTEAKQAYVVLANKYRPQRFDDMIGQNMLVTTLTHAIETGRIANAFLLTGIRGTGKTTSARIIAKALNCAGEDGKGTATTSPCGICEPCRLISQSRHPDVLEVDAASRTGVDDMREIIDNAHYSPASARYKIYIIDEVHMLSKSAFNALLKTLEEPPAHVKFIFATTEIRKIPVTILSRCQRFDLKRITTEDLTKHLISICEKESVEFEEEALTLIAKVGSGSVRDSLSILDQAIVHADSKVTMDIVSSMVGVSDYDSLLDLFEHCAGGRAKDAIEITNSLYQQGVQMVHLFEDVAQVIHLISKALVIKDMPQPEFLSIERFMRIKGLSERLELGYLTRCWQLITNDLKVIASSPVDLVAAEMLIIKLCYMSNLPSPAKVIQDLQQESSSGAISSSQAAPSAAHTSTSTPVHANLALEQQPLHTPQSTEVVASFTDIVELFQQKQEILLYSWLYNDVSLISCTPGKLEIWIPDSLPQNFTQRVAQHLLEWTGQRWMIAVSNKQGKPSLKEQASIAAQKLKDSIASDPKIAKILSLYPDAKLTSID